MILSLILFAVALAGSFLCSFSETVFSSASRIRALARSREGHRLARLSAGLMSRPESYLTTTLVSNNFVNVLAASITARLASEIGGEGSELLVALVTALILLLLGEVIPKQLAFEWRDSVVDYVAPVVYTMRIIMFPLIALVGWIPRILMRQRPALRFFESREEVRTLLEAEGDEAGRDAERILQLGSTTLVRHMRHFRDYPSVDLSTPRSQVIESALGSGARFLLVFEPGMRVLLGYVKTTVLLRAPADRSLASMTEGLPYFERDSVLGSVLYRLKRTGAHAGVVLGSDGQPEGLIDSESIVDAVLGETGLSSPVRTGTLMWEDGKSVFARSGRDVG